MDPNSSTTIDMAGAITFPYLDLPIGNGPTPAVEIAVCGSDMRHAFRVEALIDTGAVGSSLPGGALPYFGLTVEDCEPVAGITAAGAHKKALRPRGQLDVVAELAIPGTRGDYFRFVLEDMLFHPESIGAILGRDFLRYFDLIVCEHIHHLALNPLPTVERITRTRTGDDGPT